MKTKLKAWQISLLAIFAIMFAALASIFNLKATTVDEETGEVLNDNWEIDVVLYDSTVDAGTTPVTEINWDATNTDRGYAAGTPRVITMQINYKNDNAVTTYNPGTVEISIPNLFYGGYTKQYVSTNISSSGYIYVPYGFEEDTNINVNMIVGANDSTHTNYAWDFRTADAPSAGQEKLVFTNANTIEAKANFEGSIQIVYEVSIDEHSPEKYEDSCMEDYINEVYATLKLYEDGQVFTSPNWPSNYPNNISKDEYYWEYETEKDIIYVDFSEDTSVDYSDSVYIYPNQGYSYQLNNSINSIKGKKMQFDATYIKIAMSTNSSSTDKGFRATVYTGTQEITTNSVKVNYTRSCEHPWQQREYTVEKEAKKITSLDGFPAGDYYWVKYEFRNSGDTSDKYPYIGASYYINDIFPAECVVTDSNLNVLSLTDNTYVNTAWASDIYVGYPKSVYNDEAGNLTITNHVDLYVKYNNETEYEFADDDEITINLADFEFTYSGDLYSMYKRESNSFSSMKYQAILNNWTGNTTMWYLMPTTKYIGQPLTLKIGDDVLYATNNEGNYEKLSDEEYYFTNLYTGKFYNGNKKVIANGKYNCELWVRYAGNTNYTLYESFTNGNGGTKTDSDTDGIGKWVFSEEQKIVGFYYMIYDMTEGFSSDWDTMYVHTKFLKTDIPESGKLYNFSYLQTYFRDENNNLVLQNEPTIDSYANMITQDEIATFDQETYGTYMQRHCDYDDWAYYNVIQTTNALSVLKSASSVIQDAENEIFTGSYTLSTAIHTGGTFETDYIEQYNENSLVTGFYMYDLLPNGIELTSSKEDIINSLKICSGSQSSWNNCTNNPYFDYDRRIRVYDKNFKEITPADFYNILIQSIEINIVENWNNTGRTKLTIFANLEDNPLFFTSTDADIYSSKTSWYFAGMSVSYNYEISYDSYLEYGKTYTNIVYGEFDNPSSYKYVAKGNTWNLSYNYMKGTSIKTTDSGYYDLDAMDINENLTTTENLSTAQVSTIISSVISTHQDVTSYVKTDQSNYSTGIVDGSYGANYEYKLRVRTGIANVTSLIVYDNLEMAYGEKEYWQGEFLGIDTTYAKDKGYFVKPYYSENPNAGNLYNDDGTLNPDWKEYFNDTQEELHENGLAITFNSQCRTENVSCDYVDIFYKLDGTTYKLGRWGGTALAGLTVNVPSTDFYLFWRTDVSSSSYYGFSIDSIVPVYVENTNTTTGSIPSYTVEEMQDDSYPDSAFGSYTHGAYGDGVRKLWHYTYTGELNKIQDATTATERDKVKSLAFEFLSEVSTLSDTVTYTPAVLPANSLTYVTIKMKAPSDESITTLAYNQCRTQWTALDEFDEPVDFITGIESNIVKAALPNSVYTDESPTISLKFTKEINGTEIDFENMKLNKTNNQIFAIRLTSLTANDDGTYNQVIGMLSSNTGLIISQIPIGTYLLEELGDNYFDFVEFTDNNDPEIIINGVTFERTDAGYIITVSEDLSETIEFNIKVTNEIEDERFFEDKNSKENLFLKNKIEEDPS